VIFYILDKYIRYVSQYFSARNEIDVDGIPKRAITQGGSNRSTSAAIRTAPLEFAFARIRIILVLYV